MTAAPGPGTPSAPRGGRLYVVRWLDRKGDVSSRLFRKRPAAERLAERLWQRGADPLIFVTDLGDWRRV